MSNLLFSQGGISDSTGLRGGQISHKLTGQYEPLILNYGDNINVKNNNKIPPAISLPLKLVEPIFIATNSLLSILRDSSKLFS